MNMLKGYVFGKIFIEFFKVYLQAISFYSVPLIKRKRTTAGKGVNGKPTAAGNGTACGNLRTEVFDDYNAGAAVATIISS